MSSSNNPSYEKDDNYLNNQSLHNIEKIEQILNKMRLLLKNNNE